MWLFERLTLIHGWHLQDLLRSVRVQQPIAEHHGAEVEGNAKQVKNARRWKVIEIRPMPKVNSKYTVHGSGKPGVTQNRQQQHAVHRSVATQNTLAANPPPAAQISTCSSRMTKSTEIHQNQQPQVTEIRVKPNQDAQNDLEGHETGSEIQKAGPKGPSVKPVAQRQSAAAHCRAPRCRSGGQRKAGEECP